MEYQRRVEAEAKQKHLAEQHKKSTQSYPEKVAEGLHDLNLESGAVDQEVHEQLKPCMQVKISCLMLSCLIEFVLLFSSSIPMDNWNGESDTGCSMRTKAILVNLWELLFRYEQSFHEFAPF